MNAPGGKGSSPRPLSVDKNTFAKNWDNIFNKKKTDNNKVTEHRNNNTTKQKPG